MSPQPKSKKGYAIGAGGQVRYSNGELILTEEDLSSEGFGQPWGHTRSYSNRLSANPSNEGINGASWFIKECPRLANISPSPSDPNQATIVVLGVISEAVWFDYISGTGTYKARFFVQDTLVHSGDEFEYVDRQGRKFKFHDFSVTPAALKGQFKSFTNPYGQELLVEFNANNQISSFTQQPAGSSSSSGSGSSGAGTKTTGYGYAYYSSGENAGRLQLVSLLRGTAHVRRTQYVYHGSSSSFGSLGDLQSAKLQQFNGSKWEDLGTTYYRYYRSGEVKGFVHALKYLISPATYARLVGMGIRPELAPDNVLAMYADFYFEYDINQRVNLISVAGLYELYTYEYTPSSNVNGYNNWKMKTVETLPDGNQNIVYTNFAGQIMFKIFRSGSGAHTREWYEYYKYDSQGRTILAAESSAISSYSESLPGLVTLKTTVPAGLVRAYDYYTTSGTGAVVGYLQAEKVQQGGSGSPIKVREWQYTTQSDGVNTINPLWKEIAYQSDASGGSSPAVTEYDYEWYGSTLQMQQRTTTPPVISTGQNGDGNSYSRDEIFDIYGRLTWQRDELGYLTRTRYDDPSGGVLQVIQDVDTSQVSDPPAGWVTPSGGGLNLITDYKVDNLGRTTQSLGPEHAIDLSGTSINIRRATWTVYQDLKGEQWSASGYRKQSNGSFTLVNPVQITRFNGLGQETDEISAIRQNTNGPLNATDIFNQSSWVRWRRNKYGVTGLLLHEREYFLIPASGMGQRGKNYNQTDYAYDIMRRQVRIESPGATITWKVLSPQGWLLETWVGTNDQGATRHDPSGGGVLPNNMERVEANEFDGGADKGDGNLTKVTQYVNNSTSRVTVYGYDFRNRQISTDGEIDFYQSQTYDNQDHVTQVDQRNTSVVGNLVARNATHYDDQGRVYQTIIYAVNPSTGTVGNSLVDNTWYDPAGNVIQRQTSGSSAYQKTIYDGIRRAVKQYTSTNPTQSGYPYPVDVSGDTVYQQVETVYDNASNVVQVTTRDRFHRAVGHGELTSAKGPQPKARVSYMASWPDALGRAHNTADYGTFHANAFTRPAKAPARSDTVLVTTTHYNNRGEVDEVIDPKGIIAQSTYDDAGRLIKRLENYVPGGTGADQNRETDYVYNADGNLARLIAKNNITGNQTTRYVYGTSLSNSDIASNNLLRLIIYPDDSKSQRDRVVLSYNRQGELKQKQDQMGTVHVYEFDLLGRQTHDRITTLGAGVVGSVLRISQTYEVRSMVQKITSYDNPTVGAGTVVNELQFVYNDFSQLITEYQSHSGAVNTSTTPKVQYGYADGSTNTIRPTSITYPNGRVLTYGYGTTGGANDLLSRIASIIDGTRHLADYTYLGSGQIVQTHSPQPDIKLTYIKQGSEPVGDGGDQYTGWDRFGRVIDQRWIKGTTDVERVQYGFDRASNRKYRHNLVAASGQDEYYTYDGLYQLLTLKRGTLNSGKTGIQGTPTWEEDFTFDPLGNWRNYQNKINGTTNLDQDRTHNKANEILTIDGSAKRIEQNAAGNITKVPKPANWNAAFTLTYDPWNRLINVLSGKSEVATCAYDGQNRRITKTTGIPVRHYYYTQQWQIVEERSGTSTTAERQFVWGLRHLDDLVLRDKGTQRLYALHDFFSCTGITNASGAVQERYGYDAFGRSRIMTPAFGNRASSKFDWETRYDAYRFDPESGFYQVRNRYLHPTAGRWLTRDPVEYKDGMNLYSYVRNEVINLIDYLGLADENANTATYGEVRECAWLDQKNWPPPGNLGDVKASIWAACQRNKRVCNYVDGSTAQKPQDKAAWKNIVNATGKDLSKESQYFCINRDDCWWVWSCCTCLSSPGTKPKKKKYCWVKRRTRLKPTVTLDLVGKSTCRINFYKLDPKNGNCPEDEAKDRKESDCVSPPGIKEGGCPSQPGYEPKSQ